VFGEAGGLTAPAGDNAVTPATANAIYSILVEECGADSAADSRGDFVDYLARPTFLNGGAYEFRFQGSLGFGGKFRMAAGGSRWRVDYYPEDRTPERDAMVERANDRLFKLESRAAEHDRAR
jgi:hypothetical protein